MSDPDPLIKLLAKPGIHSGTALGEQLGISRVAIKKRIDRMVAEGIPVESSAGKGYRLSKDIELLDADDILDHIDPSAHSGIDLEVFSTLDSTNAHLAGKPQVSGKLGVAVAETQLLGQGRRGRQWISTPYRNLMMSLSHVYQAWPQNPSGLSLAFSVSVHSALTSLGVHEAGLKWPNDIVANGRKLGGLLVSASGEADGELKVIMGVGLNLDLNKEDRKHIDQPAVDLKDLGYKVSRNQLVAEIIINAQEMLNLYPQSGFAPFADYWNQNACFINEQVRLFDGTNEHRGELLGVDKDGQLQMDSAKGILKFNTSELSLRKL